MKKIFAIVMFAALAAVSFSQTKKDDILTLFELTETSALAGQVIGALIPQFQEFAPDVPQEYWDKMTEKIRGEDLVELLVPIYDKYYTHEDIKALLAFYQTPIGKKSVSLTPMIMQESMLAGQQWGQDIAQQILNELQKDGYISI